MADYKLGNLVWKVTGDTRDFDKNIKKTEKNAGAFGDKIKDLGAAIAGAFVVKEVVQLSKQLVDSASDVGETVNAVSKVFGESQDTILAWGENASTQAGLSQSEFNTAATVIGAQLKNAGLALDESADQTINLTERAADLASVFNTSVSEAVTAVGAGLRGESEPLRRFAVDLNANAVEAEALSLGFEKVDGTLSSYAKTQARISLLLKQSTDVAGDFKDTNDQYANSVRVAQANLENLRAEIGERLIPIFTKVVNEANDLIQFFSDFDEGTLTAIAAIGGTSAALIGLIPVVNAVKTAIISLNTAALLGPTGAIVAIGALAVAIGILGEKIKQARVQDVEQAFSEVKKDLEGVGDSAFVATQKIEAVNDALRLGARNATFESASKQVANLARNLELSKDQVIEIGLKSESVKDSYKRILQSVKEQAVKEAELLAFEQERQDAASGINIEKEIEERTRQSIIDQALEEQRIQDEILVSIQAAKDALTDLVESRKSITEEITAEQEALKTQLELQIIDREEYYEKLIELEEQFQLDLIDIGYDGVANAQGVLDIGDQQILDSITRRKELAQELKDFEVQKAQETADKKGELIQGTLTAATKALQAEKDKREKDIEDLENDYESALKNVGGYFEELGKAIAEGEDAWNELGNVALKVLADIIQAVGEELLAKAAVLAVQAIILKDPSAAIGAIAAASAGFAAFTAAGVVRASANGYENGGIVPGNSFSGDNVPANVNSGEMILNTEQQARLFKMANGEGGGGIRINYQPIFSSASEEEMERFARNITPYLEREQVRRG